MSGPDAVNEPIRWIACPNGDYLDERASTFDDEREARRHAEFKNDGEDPDEAWDLIPLYSHPAAASAESAAVVTCVYCGHAYPPGSPTHGAQLLKDHIAVCEKHPMREVIAERDELGTLLAAMYRIDTTLTEASVAAAAALAERVEKALVAVDARDLSAARLAREATGGAA